ncbi:MAG: Spy/CpxP family protein refolding chaperone [Myxococcales bacterium]|nr:Spy/CpxP family protein refolding chaperone [Myxococcales bacterium]
MHTLTTRIALALAAFGFSSVLAAGEAHAAPAGKREVQAGKHDRLCAELACTADQKAKIAEIRETNAPRIKAAKASLRGLREQVKAEWHKPRPDARALERLDAQIDAEQDKVQDMKRAARLEIHALLTPEQRSKFNSKLERGRGERGRGERGRGKRGPK